MFVFRKQGWLNDYTNKNLFHLAFCCCTGEFLLELSSFLCISNETSFSFSEGQDLF